MRKTLYALLALLMLTAAACGGDGTSADSPSAPATATGDPTETEEPCEDQTDQDMIELEMGDNFFEPTCLIVLASQPIHIENNGAALHNWLIPGTQVDIDVSPGEEFGGEGNAVNPGEYEFECKYHPEMTGTLTAQ